MHETTYYVIGDVHGYFDKLMRLVEKLPKDARLVFTGDLIDRGPQSAEVVAFVREGGHLCVRGNHEAFMVAQRPQPGRPWRKTDLFDLWMENGGGATLASYGLQDYETLRREENAERLQPFYDDIAWMRTLPYYLELEGCRVNGRTVVVSHSSVARVWGKRFTDEQLFNAHVVINRDPPEALEGIFNVFGHSPFRTPKLYDHAARIDTGPYLYGVLSALEVPSLKVVNSEA